MSIKHIPMRLLLLVAASWAVFTAQAAPEAPQYKQSEEYLALRDSVYNTFNTGDSARFFEAVKDLEAYLEEQKDWHAYYTQRCNEIVFQLNQQHVFEAYKLATQLSRELTARKLDGEMYMAINMMGHIYRYCGNKESAKQCFWDVIHRMEKEGYTESQPPIYMNLVNILTEEDPQEALKLLDRAARISREASPERVFDIETRRTLIYYEMGDMERFEKGYEAYSEGVKRGLTSVHGRSIEVFHLAQQGRVDEAVRLAKEELSDYYSTCSKIYAAAGRWQEAYQALKSDMEETDSVNSIILSSSMQGIQDELRLYEAERQSARVKLYSMGLASLLLLMLVIALVYIVQSRRKHLKELKVAYERSLESDKMKTAFIQNVSHEIRTPLNVITGFAQVMSAPDYDISPEERRHIADTMMVNTYRITTMINEVLEMSHDDGAIVEQDARHLPCNDTLKRVLSDFAKQTPGAGQNVTFQTLLADSETIFTHPTTLHRIITPLLDNACKNLPAHGGTVVVKAHTDGRQLLVEVEDNGCGIPPKEAERIFEYFVKLDNFKEGLGLGLPFCRTHARRIGGDVRLDTSYKGPGARFLVNIPLKTS